jgi:hypothetical protein
MGAGWNPFLNALFGGWSAEGITRASTGAPVNPRINQDRANVGRTYQRPDATGVSPNDGPKTIYQWFNTSALRCRRILLRHFGGLRDQRPADITGTFRCKRFRIHEGHTVQFRSEFYDLPNSVSFNNRMQRSTEFVRQDHQCNGREANSIALRYSF